MTEKDYAYQELLLKIGLRVSYYRKLNGLSQEELAERIGKSHGYVGMIEAPGVSKGVSIKTLFDISEVLNVPIQNFFCSSHNDP